MFFLLSKLLLFLLSPLTWIIILLFFSFYSKKEKRKKRARISVIVVILVFSNTFIFKEVMRQWEVFGTPVSKTKKYEVGVVLTGMFEYNNDLQTLSARRGADRIWQALNLYHSGKIKKILITGDSGYIIDKGLHEAKQTREVLISWGIKSNDVLIETKSRNTYENALETAKILRAKFPSTKSVLLITSGKHMRRSLACFEKQGVTCIPFSTDLYTGPKRSYSLEEFVVPDVSTLEDWHSLNKEIVGYFAYWASGKI